MAFRGRPGRRSFRRSKRPNTMKWVTTVFNNAALTITPNNLNEMVVMDPVIFYAPEQLEVNRVARCARVLVKGGWSFETNVVSFAQLHLQIFWALYIIDIEDTDATILTSVPSSIMNSNRVLQCGCHAFNLAETVPANGWVNAPALLPIDVDLTTRFNLRQDEQLALGMQLGRDPVSTVASWSFSAYCRVLYDTRGG